MIQNSRIVCQLLFMISPLFLLGQNSNLDKKKENQIVSKLCHTWNFDVKIDSPVHQYFPSETFSTISFLANGNLTMETASVVKGYWKYDMKNNILSLKIQNDVLNIKVLKLTDKEITFEKKSANGILGKGHLWRSD